MIACREVREWSDAFIDREFVADLHAQILHHIRECDDCATFIEYTRGLKRLVRASVRSVTAPAGLRFRVLAHIA